MDSRRRGNIDLLAAGELLIDFISADFAENLDEAGNFRRIPGGSPSNLCMNMARLGNRVSLAATVGNDAMGHYLFRYVEQHGVDVHHLHRVDIPTTLILVTRSQQVSSFEAYRGADSEISAEQFPEHLLADISIFHTTCFGLSREPARSAILLAARKAHGRGCQLSIDANYAAKIWPDRGQAREVILEYIHLGAIVKISEVDWERLYEQPLSDPATAAAHFLNVGARAVCVTMGAAGCLVASQTESHFLGARAVEVKDTTGAGDAFWSGFLTAWLDGHELLPCARAGRRMAELKLQHFGPLPRLVERDVIFEDSSQT